MKYFYNICLKYVQQHFRKSTADFANQQQVTTAGVANLERDISNILSTNVI